MCSQIFSPTVSVDNKHSVTVTMNISPSVLATLALLACSGVWAHKIRGTNSRQLMASKGVSAHLVHARNEPLLVFDLFTLSDFC